MNFLILTQTYNFNPFVLLWMVSNIKCRGSQAVRRLSRKQLRENVQGFKSLSRRRSNSSNSYLNFETKKRFPKVKPLTETIPEMAKMFVEGLDLTKKQNRADITNISQEGQDSILKKY